MLDSIALAAAEQIRKTAGPRAGVIAYRNLGSASSEETRARAALAGIDCAIAANDEYAAFSFAESWFPIRSGDWEREVVRTARKLDRAGWERGAFLLLETEQRRKPGPFVTFALARMTQRRGLEADAIVLYRQCFPLGDKAKTAAIANAAKLEVARILSRAHDTRDMALALARDLDKSTLTPRQRLIAARIGLAATSRFDRATALSTLAALAKEHPPIALAAVRRAVTHADRMGQGLTPLEADRVRAAVSMLPDQKLAKLIHARLPDARGARLTPADEEARLGADPETAELVTKARAILAGARGPVLSSNVKASPIAHATDVALEAIAEWHRDALAPHHVSKLTATLDGSFPAPPAATLIALAALASSDVSLQKAGAALAAAVLRRTASVPRGFMPLACALEARGFQDIAERAYRVAESLGESDARRALTSFLLRRARRAAREGQRTIALQRLDEARRRRQSSA